MTRLSILHFAGLAGLFADAGAAAAHVGLETPKAVIGRGYKAVLKVPHGCEGAPTVKVTVELPEGIILAKPMPKPGWIISTTRGSYAQTYTFLHGKTFGEGVKAITWSGGSLPDDYYDEFVVNTFIPAELKPDARLAFIVTQDCEKGQMRWSQIPESDEAAHHMDFPAPILTLVPADMGR